MPVTTPWFRRLGFHIWHVPGISRAWRYELEDGGCVLVTNLDGYDLPEAGGPYAAMVVSATNELIDVRPCLRNAKEAIRWFRHSLRLYVARTQ